MGGYIFISCSRIHRIGILEAVVTVIVIASLERVRPDLLAWNNRRNSKADNLESETTETISK